MVSAIIVLLLIVAAVIAGGLILHVGTGMIWTKILKAIERRFPR
jgi:hypothetical protein